MITVDCTKSYYKFLVSVLPGLFQCKVQPGPGPGPAPVPAGILKGYGVVNYWMTLSDYDGFMKTLKDNGCNCTSIELFGREEDGWINKQDVLKAQFPKMLASAKKYGITLFVNMVNWGSQSLTSQPDSWFQGWLSFIWSSGPSGLVVQAAAEWSGDKAANWCAMTENTLKGFTLSWNQGARPLTASSAYKFIDYHSTTLTDMGGGDKRTICNTDSGILNSMMNGGVMGQTFKVDQVTTFATNALNAGKSVLLYGYAHKQPDVEAVKALGKVGGVTPGPQPSDDEAAQGLDMAKAQVYGAYDPREAKKTVTIVNLALTNGSPAVGFQWNKALGWKPHDASCDGVLCVAWKRSSDWLVQYIEWKPISNTGYNWSNPLENMAESPVPEELKAKYGDLCGFFILSVDKTERSQALFGKWPLGKVGLFSRIMKALRLRK